MKGLSLLSVVLAVVALVAGTAEKFGIALVDEIGPVGFAKAAMILLLFGINFAVLELVNKK